jgi:hypothetical protein
MVTICPTDFNVQQLCIFPTECIYGIRLILRITSDYFLNSINQLICNEDELCFLWRGNWIFKCYLDELWSSKV